MQTLVKSINIISIIFVCVGICLACSIDIADRSFIIPIYGAIMLILVIGAMGIKITNDPNRYFSAIFATGYSIVNIICTLRKHVYSKFSIIDKFYIFYHEGLEMYDIYHRI